eukprot:2077660-Pyramimonas_sp.AAC.1
MSGIAQGCPSSGCVFALAADPFMTYFGQSIRAGGRGVAGACADDTGAAIRDVKHLGAMRRIFATAKRVSASKPKIKKCVIVPLNGAFSQRSGRLLCRCHSFCDPVLV